MGLVISKISLGNPADTSVLPIFVDALADTGAVHLCIPEHIRIQLKLKEIDQKEVHMKDGKVCLSDRQNRHLEELKDLGFYGVSSPREHGGLNCPAVIYLIICELFARADVSTMTAFAFAANNAGTLSAAGDALQRLPAIVQRPWI